MKLITLIMITVMLHVSAATLAQRVTLNEKNARLVDVFNDINAQTGYDFAFTTTTLKDAKPVTIDVRNEELSDVLTQIFQGQNLEFTIENKSVVVKPKEYSFLDNLKAKIKGEFAQVTVTGQVVDGTGQPMAGVTIKEKGTTNGTQTDTKGNFKLTVAGDNSVITFSYIGYESQEVAAKYVPAGSVITLKPTAENLQEVVINKGYYNEKQELSTGDVSVVSSKEIEEQPVTDPILALEGRVPGLFITQTSGIPGAYSSITIRGQNSLANGNNPLYIVDGVPFSSTSLTNNQFGGGAVGGPSPGQEQNNGSGLSPFNNLNPNDIESIEVLKDADATAIYGSRGANGVVIITTKKGTAGPTKVDFDFSQGDGQVTRMMNLMNTQQYLQMRHQAFANDGLPFPSIKTNPQDANYDVNGVWDTTRSTNWQKALLGNTAHYTNAQVAVSGGTENTQFRISGGYSGQTTVYPGNFDDEKGSVSVNINHTSSDKRFSLVFTAGYVNDNNTIPTTDLTQTAMTLAPDAPALYNRDGSLNFQPYNGTATWYNPLYYTLETAKSVTDNLTSDLVLSYKILSGLRVKTNLGYGDSRQTQTNLYPASAYAPPNENNPVYRENNFGNSEFQNWIFEPQVLYDLKVGRGTFSTTIGATVQSQTTNEVGYSTSDYGSDALLSNPANASVFQFDGETNSQYKYFGGYARIGYNWEGKYVLNITANRDGSSNFGPGRQWGNFGAVGAAWIFSKEKFIENIFPWLSFGKLRASYGTTGNDQIAPYQYLSSYSSNSSTYQGNTGLYPSIISNPYYGWEVNKKLEGGLELGFLQDRINLTASYFRNRSNDQLLPYALPTVTGFNSIEENLPALVQNTGAEFTINTQNVKSKNFSWSTSFNLTIPDNKLLAYPDLSSSSSRYRFAIGYPLSTYFVLQGTKVNPADGVYEFMGQNGYTENPNVPDDLKPVAVTQKFYGGLSNSFNYQRFHLDVFFQFVKQTGFNYWWTNGYIGGAYSNQNEPAAIVGNTWLQTNTQAKYGKLSTQNAADPNFYMFGSSDFGIGDASYIRLKNLALSFDLPDSWVKATHFQNGRIFLQAQNLLTFTNYFGLDPETGGDNLPPLRMITLGIHASL